MSSVLSTAALDKHPQSKERGITLDLGFSSFSVRQLLCRCTNSGQRIRHDRRSKAAVLTNLTAAAQMLGRVEGSMLSGTPLYIP
jgi:hypothetical protein